MSDEDTIDEDLGTGDFDAPDLDATDLDATDPEGQVLHEGGCHCGAVAYRVHGAPDRLLVCNCSICTMKGYLHWIVPRERFELVRGADAIATYTFNTGVAQHHFCRTCGVASYYIARSDPDAIDVNARCVPGLALGELPVETFDGVSWEAHYEVYRSSGPASGGQSSGPSSRDREA